MQRNNSFRGRSSRPTAFKGGRRPNKNRGPKKQTIHPSRFINRAPVASEVVEYVPTHRFSDFMLSDAIKHNLAEIGFITPSAIQDQAIPLALENKDVIGLANTGTGKTAAFLLPILNKLQRTNNFNSVLVMAPTR